MEQITRNESYWPLASLLIAFILIYDERSWNGIATHGFQYEMQRFRTRLIPIAFVTTLLPLAAIARHGILTHAFVVAVAAFAFHAYQRIVFDFSGRALNGPAKRILFAVLLGLVCLSLLPIFPTSWVPLLFISTAIGTSLSARNHLIFRICEETLAIRQRLASQQASAHNASLLSSAEEFVAESTDDIGLKAG